MPLASVWALRLFGKNGLQAGELLVLCNLGLALRLVGRLEESVQRFEQALRIARFGDDQMKVATLLNNLAATQLALGNTEAALANASTAVRLHDEIDDRRGLAYAWLMAGDRRRARLCWQEALERFDRLPPGDRGSEAERQTIVSLLDEDGSSPVPEQV